MRDISQKNTSLRTAMGYGLVFCHPETVKLYRENKLPKGIPEGVVEAAGMVAAKSTGTLVPHCHQVNIEEFVLELEIIEAEKHQEILPDYALHNSGFLIRGTAKSISRAGVEMELMTGLSIACVTLYEQLKPVDEHLEIGGIKLLEKGGGQKDRQKYKPQDVGILICSEAIYKGKKPDAAGQWIRQQVGMFGSNVVKYDINPGSFEAVENGLRSLIDNEIPIILTVGGTGVGPADQVVKVVKKIIEEPVSSIPDAIWHYGHVRTERSIFSQLAAGFSQKSLIVTLPGSLDGAQSAINSLLPAIYHFPKMLKKKPG